MLQKTLSVVLLLATFVGLVYSTLGRESPEGSFVWSHSDSFGSREGIAAMPNVPVTNARYKTLTVTRTGADAGSFAGSFACEGIADARGQRVPSITFKGGVATLEGCHLVGDLEIGDTKRVGGTAVSGFWSVVPPILAILLAIVIRDVLVALIAGIWAGVVILEGSLFTGTLRTLDRHVVGALSDAGHLKILVFSCMLGGVVALVSRMGGFRAIVNALSRRGQSPRAAQLYSWLMGIFVFFDDYANALLVGNTMRPVTDRFRVSREKLAYIVDSTAAPVACIAVISTWIATELSYVGDWLKSNGGIADYPADSGEYALFLDSIPFSFYPILTIVFVFFVSWLDRDFWSMGRAERRARTEGKLLADGAVPLTSQEIEAAVPVDPTKLRWWNGVIPVLTIVLATVLGLYLSGAQALPSGHLEASGLVTHVRDAFGKAASYDVLLWATGLGLVVAWGLALGQKLLPVRELSETTLNGMKSMFVALVVLTLAWTLADICKLLNTAGFLVQQIEFKLEYLPAAVFGLSAVVGFATGSSWGTMGILIPLTLTYAAELGRGEPQLVPVLLGSLGAVLAGAVFGDHCSPISDTTVMSSMATGCDHLDHVKTQLPYALLVAVVAVLVGYIPAGFGTFEVYGIDLAFSPWTSLAAGGALLLLWVLVIGRRNPRPAETPSEPRH